jgi:prefoldin subunit 5
VALVRAYIVSVGEGVDVGQTDHEAIDDIPREIGWYHNEPVVF